MGLSTHLLITYLSTHPCKRFPVISSLFLFVNLILVQVPLPITSSSSNSPRCTSITSPLFHSRLKTYLFHKSYPPPFPVVSLLPPGLPPRIFAWIVSADLLGFLFDFFLIFSFLGHALEAGHPVSFWAHVNLYRIVSYRKRTVHRVGGRVTDSASVLARYDRTSTLRTQQCVSSASLHSWSLRIRRSSGFQRTLLSWSA